MSSIPKPIPKLGLYPYSYAVEDIAKQMGFEGGPKTSLLLAMAGAIRGGQLQVRSAETGAPFSVAPTTDNPSPYVTIDDINRWLEVKGFSYRWTPRAEHSGPQLEQVSDQPKLQARGESDDPIQSNADGEDQDVYAAQPDLPGLPKAMIVLVDWPGKTNLRNLLSDVPNWLESGRVRPGKPGPHGSALWDPAQIAICLLTERNVPKRALEHHLRTCFPEYLPRWDRALEIEGFNTGNTGNTGT